jgi:hypothetical protein
MRKPCSTRAKLQQKYIDAINEGNPTRVEGILKAIEAHERHCYQCSAEVALRKVRKEK